MKSINENKKIVKLSKKELEVLKGGEESNGTYVAKKGGTLDVVNTDNSKPTQQPHD